MREHPGYNAVALTLYHWPLSRFESKKKVELSCLLLLKTKLNNSTAGSLVAAVAHCHICLLKMQHTVCLDFRSVSGVYST